MGCMRPYFKKLGVGKRRVESWPGGQEGLRICSVGLIAPRHPVSLLDPTMLCRLPINSHCVASDLTCTYARFEFLAFSLCVPGSKHRAHKKLSVPSKLNLLPSGHRGSWQHQALGMQRIALCRP